MNLFISLVLKVLRWFNLHPVVKCGTTRMTFVFYDQGFAVKVPILWLKAFFVSCWHYSKRPRFFWKYISWEDSVTHSAQFYLLKGILDNWREYTFYQKHKGSRFLFPTIFSFAGLFNITPLGDEIPGEINLWRKLLDLTDEEVARDGHHFAENENFTLYCGAIMIRDYGSKRTQSIITKHFTVLNNLPKIEEFTTW